MFKFIFSAAVLALTLLASGLTMAADNTTDHGRFDVPESVTFVQGEEAPLYPVRGPGCSDVPPSFEDAVKWSKPDFSESLGLIYDAGVGRRESGKCNGALVATRILGLRASKEFVGEAKVSFFKGYDSVRVAIKARPSK